MHYLRVKPKRVAPHTATSEFITLECSLLSEKGWIWASEGGMKRRKAALLTQISHFIQPLVTLLEYFLTKSAGKNIVQ